MMDLQVIIDRAQDGPPVHHLLFQYDRQDLCVFPLRPGVPVTKSSDPSDLADIDDTGIRRQRLPKSSLGYQCEPLRGIWARDHCCLKKLGFGVVKDKAYAVGVVPGWIQRPYHQRNEVNIASAPSQLYVSDGWVEFCTTVKQPT